MPVNCGIRSRFPQFPNELKSNFIAVVAKKVDKKEMDQTPK